MTRGIHSDQSFRPQRPVGGCAGTVERVGLSAGAATYGTPVGRREGGRASHLPSCTYNRHERELEEK